MPDGFVVASGASRAAFDHLQARGYGTGAPSLASAHADGDAAANSPGDAALAGTETARAYMVHGDVVAGCHLIPFVTLWGDDEVPMGGIGGVAALPEVRRQGYTQRVLAGCLEEMRAGGVPISFVVTPFSYGFYRKMGWGYAFRHHSYRMPVRAGASLGGQASGEAEFVRWPGERLAPEAVPDELESVYLSALRPRYQGIARRDGARWRDRLAGGATHAYLWRGPDGPSGYAILSRRDDLLRVRELVFSEPDALRGLLGLVANFDSQAREALVELPPDVALDAALPEQNELQVRIEPRGTVRIVDLPQALGARRWPRATNGVVDLEVTDAIAPWQAGRWEIRVEGGRAEARRPARRGGHQGSAPAAAMDISVLSSLYAGGLTVRDAVRFGLARAEDGAAEALDRLFGQGRLPLHLEWY